MIGRSSPVFWAALVVSLQAAAGPAAISTEAAPVSPKFAIEADPTAAKRINRFLAQVSMPTEVLLPTHVTARHFLTDRCGGDLPDTTLKSAKRSTIGDAAFLQFTPCLRFRMAVEIKIRADETLESLAGRLGLSPDNVGQFVHLRASSTSRRPLDPKASIEAGDRVIVPKVPQWTIFRADATKITGIHQLVDGLAQALQCGARVAEECLIQHHVIAFENPASSPDWIAPPNATSAIKQVLDSVDIWARSANVMSDAAAANFSLSVADTHPIASSQWPYDLALVTAILKAAIAAHPELRPTVLGVADGGLAAKDGKPLPTSAFTTIPSDRSYAYPNDSIGAGVDRSSEPQNGDVGLCPPGQDTHVASTWPPLAFQLASHGSVVASLASGLALRSDATLQNILPVIAFFRLSTADCTVPPAEQPNPQDVFDAIRYLDGRASVVNVSYIDSSDNPFFPYALKTELAASNTLLVVPAGNDGADLDALHQCPPCLANADWPMFDPGTGHRVLVIGAATRDLQPADFSGGGRHTVYLYAPGEPFGAVDLLGQNATFPPATSYAAPYAAMAAALLRSLGMNDTGDIVHRLRAASWPLAENGSMSSGFDRGIIDLAKVAAARLYAVETLEVDEGAKVRRTYVGQLSQKLDQLVLCPGIPVYESVVQAVRISEPDASGNRTVTAHTRKADVNPPLLGNCKPTGSLTLTDLSGIQRTIQMDSVTEILAPWLQ